MRILKPLTCGQVTMTYSSLLGGEKDNIRQNIQDIAIVMCMKNMCIAH